MVKYNWQHAELSEQDEVLEDAIQERAEQLQKTAEVEVEDEQSAFVGCMTDHVKTAMEELVTDLPPWLSGLTLSLSHSAVSLAG